MKKMMKTLTAALLAVILLVQSAGAGLSAAAEELERAFNPAEQLELTVPAALQDGENYVFLAQEGVTLSEKSGEKVYLPIQRTGDVSGEGDVTLKLVDLTSHYGVNYQVEVYKENVEPAMALGDVSLVDVFANPVEQNEVETTDEDGFAEAIHDAGGATLVDANGEDVARITTYRLEENSSPAQGTAAVQESEETTETAEKAEEPETEEELSPVERLKAGRSAFTGVASDRQDLETENALGLPQEAQEPAQLVQDTYPGKKFALHFAPGEEAKFLVITPRYSEAADGDSQFLLLLKDASEGLIIAETNMMTHVTITDEDAQETVTIGLESETVTAENGKAVITVTREGRINAIVGVRVASFDGTATVGEEYGGVNAKLYFPMGITRRSIELPVEAGPEEKDFFVTLNGLDEMTGVELGAATAKVVIPAGEVQEETASLMADEPYLDSLDLPGAKQYWGGDVTAIDPNGTLKMSTRIDKEKEKAYAVFRVPQTYAYDGLRMEYLVYNNFCESTVWIESQDGYTSPFVDGAWSRRYNSGGVHGGQSVDWYYGSAKAPLHVSTDIWNRSNGGTVFNDSYTRLEVQALRPIKRSFTVRVENPQPMTWLGRTEAEAKAFQAFLVDGSIDTSGVTLRTGDSFSVSRRTGPEYARLVGLEVQNAKDKTWSSFTIGTLDGQTGTVVVTLDTETIDKLAENYITWTQSSDSRSYSGGLVVRPKFQRLPAAVEILPGESQGTLQYQDRSGAWKDLTPGTKYEGSDALFALGDKPTFRTANAAQGAAPSGFAYTVHKDSTAGEYFDSGTKDYLDEHQAQLEFSRQAYYKLTPTFTQTGNSLVVKVAAADLDKFDTTKGLFAKAESRTQGSDTLFTVAADVLCNQLMTLEATPKNSAHVPVWSVPGTGDSFSGGTFYHMTGPKAEQNVITLGVSEKGNTWYSVTGTVYSQEINLSTGHTTGAMTPAAQAVVAAGPRGAVTGQSGGFELAGLTLAGGTQLRYVVTYNGISAIQSVKLPPVGVPTQKVTFTQVENGAATAKTVDAIVVSGQYPVINASNSTGARFTSVSVDQTGVASGNVDALPMNGQRVVLKLTVDTGAPYTYTAPDGTLKTATETVKDIVLTFKNQYTREIHASYSLRENTLTYDAAAGVATLVFDKFSPENPEDYTYGDALFAQLITDKNIGLNDFNGDGKTTMSYDPVSTGIAVVADRSYEPETVSLDLLSNLDFQDDSAHLAATRSNYGKFPFLGEITAAINIIGMVKNLVQSSKNKTVKQIMDHVEAMDPAGGADDDDDYEPVFVSDEGGEDGTGSLMAFSDGPAISFFLKVKETPYGGVRFMFAGVAMWGVGSFDANRYNNPYKSVSRAKYRATNNDLAIALSMGVAQDLAKDIGVKNEQDLDIDRSELHSTKQALKDTAADFSGPYAKIGGYLGVYVDYGYIQTSTTTMDGKEVSRTHDMVFMGAGGFFGFTGAVGYTQHVIIVCVPAYVNVELAGNVTVYLGASANPKQTLENYRQNKHHDDKDWGFNAEVYGDVSLALTFGVGWYKLLGARITGKVGFELGFSNNMAKWYPNLGGNWGYGADFSVSGTLDLIFTSIPLASFSWPLPLGSGFIDYFRHVRMANNLINMVNKQISAGKVPSSVTQENCVNRIWALQAMLDKYTGTTQQLKDAITDLREYAYNNKVIDWWQYQRSKMTQAGGIGGAVADALLMEDSGPEEQFFVRDHVDSQWVAGDNASLMAAYGAVSSEKLVDNAIQQPSATMVPINDDEMLMVFLTDNNQVEKVNASQLMWTVYRPLAETNKFDKPQAVLEDGTADGKPNLIDGGDKLILSWSSIDPLKFAKYRTELTQRLTQELGRAPTEAEIEAELDRAPTDLLAMMEIYTVNFDKATKTFGEVTQLTDDAFYDDDPQAAYDPKTGDYAVYYLKTAQDGKEYTSESQKLLDLINPYRAGKTYSIISYMLYNNQAGAVDSEGKTHGVGWAMDYVFDNETVLEGEELEEYLAVFKGERQLPTTILSQDGAAEITDPAIADLTVSSDGDGTAVLAFTVDKDTKPDTSEDKELYIQLFEFETHGAILPVRIAGDRTVVKASQPADKTVSGLVTTEVTQQVSVGSPKLINNGGSTWLFWREDNNDLRYLNITELLDAKVGENEYAVREDGTIDERYELRISDVDFGGAANATQSMTDYQVVSDPEGNLYIIWTDSVQYLTEDAVDGSAKVGTALEVFASAMIREEQKDGEATAFTANWSKPYRLTRDNKYNDGISAAVDRYGNLIILHNQYTFEDKSGDYEYLLAHNMIFQAAEDTAYTNSNGDAFQLEAGQYYIKGDPMVQSPTALMVTCFQTVGSVEVTDFGFSDVTPCGGDVIDVTAAIENTGLITAEGFSVQFYALTKDGKETEIPNSALVSRTPMLVNTSTTTSFQWQVPAQVEGLRIKAVCTEIKTGDALNAMETLSPAFTLAPELSVELEDVEQVGDSFLVEYTVTNEGNAPTAEGTTAYLDMVGLFGDLEDKYHVESPVVEQVDVSGLAPNKTKMVSTQVALPFSLFEFCGYDALQVFVTDEDEAVLAQSQMMYAVLEEPIHLVLNERKAISLQAGESYQAALTCDSTVFMEEPQILYYVDDPSVATVDEKGKVTALTDGWTKLIAVLLPSGRTVSVGIHVGDKEYAGCGKGEECPLSAFTDLRPTSWYHDGVHAMLEYGIMNGVSKTAFEPYTDTSRAMIVTMIWRLEGEPEVDEDLVFTDVKEGRWYTEAIRWAASEGIINGVTPTTFAPNRAVTREELAVMLHRYAQSMLLDTGAYGDLSVFQDGASCKSWSKHQMAWAVGAGILQGMGNDTLNPKGKANRAQVATMLTRWRELVS